MKNRRNIKRRGFTLVELLIVIVVIGILSAMMMLSSTEAVTSARASNIVSNLRNFKTAAMAMYVDYLDTMDKGTLPTPPTGKTTHDLLVNYMNKGGSSANGVDDTDNYHLKLLSMTGTNAGHGWYVYVRNVNDSRVREKLAGRAASVGLLKSDGATQYAGGDDGTEVYMFVTKIDASQTSPSGTQDTYTATAGS